MKSSEKSYKQITVFCGVLIKDGKTLMTLRSEPECPKAHLKWEFPGGKVNIGETPKEALKREFFEETGIKIKVDIFLPFVHVSYWDYKDFKTQVISLAFKCDYVNQIEQLKKDHHVAEIKWIKLQDVEKLDCLPGVKEMLNIALRT